MAIKYIYQVRIPSWNCLVTKLVNNYTIQSPSLYFVHSVNATNEQRMIDQYNQSFLSVFPNKS